MRKLEILVVDDDLDLADMLGALLEGEGHTVDVVYSGEEAIDFLRRYQYQMVVLDMILPGIDGLQVYETVGHHGTADHHVEAPMYVFIGDHPFDRLPETCVGLVKPFDPQRLIHLASARANDGFTTSEHSP